MLGTEENERLCRVGPDSPMGRAFRRYWLPACTSDELEDRPSDPLPIRLLGEDLIALRDADGNVGVIDEYCPHRCTSLALGHMEDDGVRCLYHGWKVAPDGTILDTPNVAGDVFKTRVKARAYPTYERGGLIWVYMGPADKVPPKPDFRFMNVDSKHRYIRRWSQDCNYLQILEGGLDTSHFGILHQDVVTLRTAPGETMESAEQLGAVENDPIPHLEIEDTEFGFHYSATRRGPRPGTKQVRVTPFILPFGRIIAPSRFVIFEVPEDDTHTCTVNVFLDEEKEVVQEDAMALLGLDDEEFWDGKRLSISRRRGIPQDRAAMREGRSFSGLRGLVQEDTAVVLSMGELADRTGEHVVPADRAILHARRLLLECARRVEAGEDPPGVAAYDADAVAAPDQIVPEDVPWQQLAPGHTKTDRSHARRPSEDEIELQPKVQLQ